MAGFGSVPGAVTQDSLRPSSHYQNSSEVKQFVEMVMRSLPSWFKLLCLLPFAVGALLPVGMMPGVSNDGMLTLVICTPEGAVEKSFPASDQNTEHVTDWCLFSQLSAPALLPLAIRTIEDDRFTKIAIVISKRDVLAHTDVPRPQPRGPPVTL